MWGGAAPCEPGRCVPQCKEASNQVCAETNHSPVDCQSNRHPWRRDDATCPPLALPARVPAAQRCRAKTEALQCRLIGTGLRMRPVDKALFMPLIHAPLPGIVGAMPPWPTDRRHERLRCQRRLPASGPLARRLRQPPASAAAPAERVRRTKVGHRAPVRSLAGPGQGAACRAPGMRSQSRAHSSSGGGSAGVPVGNATLRVCPMPSAARDRKQRPAGSGRPVPGSRGISPRRFRPVRRRQPDPAARQARRYRKA